MRCGAHRAVFQRLLAPFLPFVAEEVWSWWQLGSVHRASWPDAAELLDALGDVETDSAEAEDEALAIAADVLKEVRKAKSEARRPMRAPVTRVVVHDSATRLAALALGVEDLRLAGSIETVATVEAEEFAVEVELAEEPPDGS